MATAPNIASPVRRAERARAGSLSQPNRHSGAIGRGQPECVLWRSARRAIGGEGRVRFRACPRSPGRPSAEGSPHLLAAALQPPRCAAGGCAASTAQLAFSSISPEVEGCCWYGSVSPRTPGPGLECVVLDLTSKFCVTEHLDRLQPGGVARSALFPWSTRLSALL
ncbi:hypothetical protein CALCODRAFT_188020 [Calocera cornea HHB12733]|uniref:Uncharacterized protein n=1 Tax=Calocera cornea HHB12733 TaxID=1353952 RepID=A0A165C9Q1_9BASI|nr:hypothetical protein CALCODRAFT_188020 [Calocera cornea HHB12733]